MQNEFNVIMSSLRKERGISQKQAAQDLGVSQSLLSHYENGIRECGLGFLNKAADYYGVSTDYLLGRTDQNRGADSDSEISSAFDDKKRVLLNSADVLLELMRRCKNEEITDAAMQIYRLQLYYTVRIVSLIYRDVLLPSENGHKFFMDAGEILNLSAKLERLTSLLDNSPVVTDEQLRQEFAEKYTDLKLLIKEVGRNLI